MTGRAQCFVCALMDELEELSDAADGEPADDDVRELFIEAMAHGVAFEQGHGVATCRTCHALLRDELAELGLGESARADAPPARRRLKSRE